MRPGGSAAQEEGAKTSTVNRRGACRGAGARTPQQLPPGGPQARQRGDHRHRRPPRQPPHRGAQGGSEAQGRGRTRKEPAGCWRQPRRRRGRRRRGKEPQRAPGVRAGPEGLRGRRAGAAWRARRPAAARGPRAASGRPCRWVKPSCCRAGGHARPTEAGSARGPHHPAGKGGQGRGSPAPRRPPRRLGRPRGWAGGPKSPARRGPGRAGPALPCRRRRAERRRRRRHGRRQDRQPPAARPERAAGGRRPAAHRRAGAEAPGAQGGRREGEPARPEGRSPQSLPGREKWWAAGTAPGDRRGTGGPEEGGRRAAVAVSCPQHRHGAPRRTASAHGRSSGAAPGRRRRRMEGGGRAPLAGRARKEGRRRPQAAAWSRTGEAMSGPDLNQPAAVKTEPRRQAAAIGWKKNRKSANGKPRGAQAAACGARRSGRRPRTKPPPPRPAKTTRPARGDPPPGRTDGSRTEAGGVPRVGTGQGPTCLWRMTGAPGVVPARRGPRRRQEGNQRQPSVWGSTAAPRASSQPLTPERPRGPPRTARRYPGRHVSGAGPREQEERPRRGRGLGRPLGDAAVHPAPRGQPGRYSPEAIGTGGSFAVECFEVVKPGESLRRHRCVPRV